MRRGLTDAREAFAAGVGYSDAEYGVGVGEAYADVVSYYGSARQRD